MSSTEGVHGEMRGMLAGCKSQASLPSKAQWWEVCLSTQAPRYQPHAWCVSYVTGAFSVTEFPSPIKKCHPVPAARLVCCSAHRCAAL